MLLTATLVASTLSIATSILIARHKWLLVLWLTLFTNIGWAWTEIVVMTQIDNPLDYAACLVPTVVAGGGAIVGLWRWFTSIGR